MDKFSVKVDVPKDVFGLTNLVVHLMSHPSPAAQVAGKELGTMPLDVLKSPEQIKSMVEAQGGDFTH